MYLLMGTVSHTHGCTKKSLRISLLVIALLKTLRNRNKYENKSWGAVLWKDKNHRSWQHSHGFCLWICMQIFIMVAVWPYLNILQINLQASLSLEHPPPSPSASLLFIPAKTEQCFKERQQGSWNLRRGEEWGSMDMGLKIHRKIKNGGRVRKKHAFSPAAYNDSR